MAKKERIQEMFDSIAPEYDAFNHLTSLGTDRNWRRKALREVRGPRVLDEACGTGDFSIAIARHLARSSKQPEMGFVGKTGVICRRMAGKAESGRQNIGDLQTKEPWHVTGVDISEGMLEVMRRKVADAGLEGAVSATKGDCCALDFACESFDTVTVAFGVRNYENREGALAEALRVLRPGGRFVMLELGIPQNRIIAWGFKFYFTRIMPLIGGRMSGNKDAYRYLPASVLAFPKPQEWVATMQKAGFRDVKHRSLSLGICNLFVGTK